MSCCGPAVKRLTCLEHEHAIVAVAASSTRASRACGSPRTGAHSGTGVLSTCVVVVPVCRLLELHDVDLWDVDELLGDNRADDQNDEEHEHREVHDRVSYDTTLAELRLLERVDWGTDLTAGNG